MSPSMNQLSRSRTQTPKPIDTALYRTPYRTSLSYKQTRDFKPCAKTATVTEADDSLIRQHFGSRAYICKFFLIDLKAVLSQSLPPFITIMLS